MSLAASSTAPRMTLDKTPCNNIGKAEDQPCNVTDDNLKTDCYESMHAFKKIRTSTSGLRKSPNKWTKEENQKLAALVAHYGEKKWKRISAEMGGQKTGAQCAQHWKRVLSPEIRKGHWDENEEDLLLRLVVQYGSCWKKIAKKIPQRTDIQCRYQYLKAKQSREVKWDAKEDESLIKKVMEMANCTFFKFVNDGSSCTTINSYDTPTNGYANSLAGSTNSMTSPMSLSSVINNNKENENDNHVARTNGFRLSSSVNSDLSDDRSSLRSSGGSSSGGSSGSETDTKDTDVSMSDSTSDLRSSSSSISGSGIMMEKDGASCHPAPTTSASFNNNLGMAMHKVVWLEIAEHMARMKLTSTLRTALECKTRFLELVGNISVSGSPTNGQDSKPFDLKSSGGINAPSESRNAASHSSPSFLHRTPSSGGTSPNDTNINININNASDHNNNHISITNFSRNITINITNSPTNSTRSPHNNTNNAYNPRPHSSPSHPHNPNNINGTIVKTESTSSSMETSPTTNTRTSTSTSTSTSTTTAATTSASTNSSTNNNNMPNAPSFPSFPPHFSPVAQPLAATAKPARSNSNNNNSNSNSTSNNGSNNNNNNNGNGMMNMNGLDSLAAVASILPRELLADYAQF